jgi:hypothetical protein
MVGRPKGTEAPEPRNIRILVTTHEQSDVLYLILCLFGSQRYKTLSVFSGDEGLCAVFVAITEVQK